MFPTRVVCGIRTRTSYRRYLADTMLATGASFDADCNNGLENGVSHAAMLAYAPASGMVSATPPAQASVSNRYA